MVRFTPTSEQQAIYDAAKIGYSFVVEAGAGAGKTSTLAEASAQRVTPALYLAYNRAIVEDSAGVFPGHVTCRTAHSIAYRAIGHQYKVMLSQGAVQGWQIAKALGVKRWEEGKIKLSGPQVASLARATIKRWSHTTDTQISPWHVPVPGNIATAPAAKASLVAAVVSTAGRLWNRAVDPNQTTIRFDHDWYLKLFAHSGPGGTVPQLGYGMILFDECQDADPLIRHIFEQQANCQRIACGDSSQAIYAWRGAEDAIAAFRAAGAPVLTLTTSFRFGQEIADVANLWLDSLGAKIRLTGNPNMTSTVGPADTSKRHMVLCRTNAGVITTVMGALENKVKVAMVGCDKEVMSLATDCDKLRSGKATDHPELIGFASWNELETFVDSKDCDNATLRTLVRLASKYEIGVLSRALGRCVPEREALMTVSTAHKAKGRQAGQVIIGGDFEAQSAPRGDAGGDGAANDDTGPSMAEMRLAYVGVTRARQVLDCRNLDHGRITGTADQ